MEIEKFRLLVRQIETPAAKQGVSGEGAGNMTLKAKFDEYELKAELQLKTVPKMKLLEIICSVRPSGW